MVQQLVNAFWVLTGDGSPQGDFGIQNRRIECVHAGSPPFSNISVYGKGQKKRRREQSRRRFFLLHWFYGCRFFPSPSTKSFTAAG
jgi:hypothetical protein